MQHRQTGSNQQIAASKSGFSERTARRIETDEHQTQTLRRWRTRTDPLSAVWESELVGLLQKAPTLTPTTLWEYLDERYPDRYPYSVLRTLQRRVKRWRATHGPDKEVIFSQSVPMGWQGLSDFTELDIEITIQSRTFKHLLYQYKLAYSGWRSVSVVQGGESYSALACGLQRALHRCGGSPQEHRTDSLSAAYVNHTQEQQLTERYQALCNHYTMKATRNNRSISHENGTVETAHGHFKHRLRQAIALRGSSDFERVDDYQKFIDKICSQLNRRCKQRFSEEKSHLKSLPSHQFMAYGEMSVRVTRTSTINIKRVLYSVPSRLIGERVRVHLYHDHLAGFVGTSQVFELPRVYPIKGNQRAQRIDLHHVIHSLSSKPQAFRHCKYRDELFPNASFRQLWQRVEEQFDSKVACKWMVAVLRMVCEDESRMTLGDELLALTDESLPDLKTLQSRYLKHQSLAHIDIKQHALGSYDRLLSKPIQPLQVNYVTRT